MDLKELEKLVKLCRKYGIEALKTAQVELKIDLGHLATPKPSIASISHPGANGSPSEAEPTKYSEEDLLLWSSGPTLPE